MSNILNEIVDGSLEKVALEPFNENSLYSISDYPIGGISQIQMTNALNSSQSGLYMVNSVYMCIDDGDNYIKNHCYKFTYLDAGAYQWVDITPWNESITTTLNELNTIDTTKLYSIIDYPIGGITNEQMINAVISPELYQINSVYLCIDDGNYLKNHFYKFTTLSWEDVTPEFVGELKDLTLEELESEAIDENTLYNIKDYPIGGISSLQMVNALKPEQIGFYQIGSVYLCTDDYSDYIKHHFYRFDYNEETDTYSWVDTKAGADIDKELSLESENPVANKAITEKLNSKANLSLNNKFIGDNIFTTETIFYESPKVSIDGKPLPDEYQAVDYIKSSGNDWINTGVYGGSSIEFEIDFQTDSLIASGDGHGSIFGSRNGNNSNEFQLITYIYSSSTPQGSFSYGNVRYNAQLDNNRNIYAFHNKQLIKNNNIIATVHNNTFTNSYPIYIFADNSANSIHVPSKTAVYSFKLWNYGVLVRDFVPCYRKLDNVIGFYDMVNEKFYSNDGNGTLSYGTIIDTVVITSPLISEDYLNANYYNKEESDNQFASINNVVDLQTEQFISGSKTFAERPLVGKIILPEDYQELEYIQRNNLEYIEIPYKPNNNTKVEVKFWTNGNPPVNSGSNCVFGAAAGYASQAFEFFMTDDGFFVWGNNIYKGQNGINANSDYIVTLDKRNIYVNGELKGTFTDTGAFTAPVNLCIFSANRNGSIFQNPYQLNIYYLNVYEDNQLLYNLIPCYRKVDNIAGMYDIINNNFYSNSGEGEFVKGNHILTGEVVALQSEIPEITANLENEPTAILDKLTIEGTTYKVPNPKYNITEITMDEENIYITIE